MNDGPLTGLAKIYEKIVDAGRALPPPLAYSLLAVVAIITMTLLGGVLPTNVFWLVTVLLILALILYVITDLGSRRRSQAVAESQSSATGERVIYHSSKSSIRRDFKGTPDAIWQGKGKDAKPISAKGLGELRFEEGGILNVRRTNTDGRFAVHLRSYWFPRGTTQSCLLKNELIGGERDLDFSFEAKASGAEHTVRVVLKNEETENWLGWGEVRVMNNQWTPFQLHFSIDPSFDCNLRMDDMNVSNAPSSVQLRNLRLVEIVEAQQ